MNDIEARALATRVEEQLASLESVSDPGARVVRSAALDAVASLVELYGAGLGRILAIVGRASDPAVSSELNAEFARDEVVSHLLLIHDMHPDPVNVRVERALSDVHEAHRKKNGHIELIGITGGGAQLRIVDAGQGCHSTGAELQRLAEEAILAAAPELTRVDAVIATDNTPVALVPLTRRRDSAHASPVEAME